MSLRVRLELGFKFFEKGDSGSSRRGHNVNAHRRTGRVDVVWNVSSEAKSPLGMTALEFGASVLLFFLNSLEVRDVVGDRFSTKHGVSVAEVDIAWDCHVVSDLVLESTSNLLPPSSQRLQTFPTEAKTRQYNMRQGTKNRIHRIRTWAN